MHKLKKLIILTSVLLLIFAGSFYYLKTKVIDNKDPNIGIVAFNVDKTIFTVGEEAYMQFAVLDDIGKTLCSAELAMEIVSPLGKKTLFESWDGVGKKPQYIISDSGECEAENVIDLPDYFAFMRLNDIGEYQVKITASNNSGKKSIVDKFEVRKSAPFDIRRTAPTRIYPHANYVMRVIVKVNENFKGTIEEQIPLSFKLTDVELKQLLGDNIEPIILDSKITTSGDTQIISSNVSWKVGERYKLTYTFDAPNISPEFYLLGPFVIGEFQEIRQWQIASDAVTNNGLLNYGRQANTGMNYVTTFTSGTLDTEYTDTDTSASAIKFIKSVSAPTREEKFIAHQKADGRLDVLTCTTDCNASGDWTLRATFSGMTSVGNSGYRAFDIAYEQLSGRAVIVFADSTDSANTLYYCLWNGSSWTPETECSGGTFFPGTGNDINFTDISTNRWVRLVSHGDRLTDMRSDEMLLAVAGFGGFEVARWTGSTWADILNISTVILATVLTRAFDVAWESSSGDGLVVFDKTASDGTTYYRRYLSGLGWAGTDQAGPDTGSGDNNWIELASDPMSDRISVIIGDDEDDAHLYMWREDGSSLGFTTTGTNPIDSMIEPSTGKDVATAWSRFNSNAIFSYTDSADLDQDVVCYTTAGGFGSVNADRGGSASDDVDNVIYIGSPNSAEVFYLKGDIKDDLTAGTWDGVGCSSGDFTDLTTSSTITADLSVTADNSAPIEFWYSYDPYSAWSRNWRFYDDETVNTPTTGLNGAAENVTPTGVDAEEFIRLRMNFAELGGEAQTDTRKKLQYTSGCTPNTSETACTWTDVGDTIDTSAVWRYASNGTDGASVCSSCDDNTVITTSLTGSTQAGTYVDRINTATTYYFDGSDAVAVDGGSDWVDVTNSDDGSTATKATTTTEGGSTITIEGTNSSGASTISAVRARVYGLSIDFMSPSQLTASIYTDGLAESLGFPFALYAEGWGNYVTLSTPSGGWTWAKLAALETQIFVSNGEISGTFEVQKVEIEVTSSASNMDHNALAIVEYDYPLKAENVANSTTYYFRAWDNGQQSRVYREQDDDGNNDCATATCTYPSLTTSAGGAVISVVVTNGTVTYGNVGAGASKSTLSGDLNNQQDAVNTGSGTEDLNIKGVNSGCPWTLSASASGTDNYVHEFSTNTGTDWIALTTSYQGLATGVAQNATQSFDLRLTAPADSSCFNEQGVDVTVQAVAG